MDVSPLALTVASYNIQHGHAAGFDWDRLAEAPRSVGADLLGLQEVDLSTRRNGGRDTVAGMSAATGLPHAAFMPSMTFDGGQYGGAVLSAYPILSVRTVPLYAGGGEPRACGHAVLSVRGRPLHFLNTHLSYDETDIQRRQMREIAALLPPSEPFVLTGDFNTSDRDLFEPLLGGETRRALVNDLSADGGAFRTFRTVPLAIDNIVYSADALALTDCGMADSPLSDHNLLWARFTLM